MSTNLRIRMTIPLAMLLCTVNLVAEDSLHQQLIEAIPQCDIDQDGQLTPSEIKYALSLAGKRQRSQARGMATALLQASYSPTSINESKRFGPQPGRKIKLFVLSGQSNMVGQGLSAELPDLQVTPNERILMFEDGKWQPLRPLKVTFGPEVTFAHAMAEHWPDETIGIVKQAVGGTGVLAWHPQWTQAKANLTNDGRKGNLWKALTDKVQQACEAADCEVSGFIWQQGAKDMISVETGKAYLENLSALVSGLRMEIGVADLPLILGSYRQKGMPDDISKLDLSALKDTRRPGAGYVLRAQWEAQKELSPAKTIPLRDLPTHPANVHYNTEGIMRLGELFARGYVDLTEK